MTFVYVSWPSRYLTVIVFGQRSTTWLIVHQRDWSLPQHYPPFINVTQRYSTWPQRDLNVTSTWPQLDLNLTSTWPQLDPNLTQRHLNVTHRYSTWSQRYLKVNSNLPKTWPERYFCLKRYPGCLLKS